MLPLVTYTVSSAIKVPQSGRRVAEQKRNRGKYMRVPEPRGKASGNDRLHVLMVSNHRDVQNNIPCVGVHIDRQIASLKTSGLEVSTFDLGRSHSPAHLFRKWRELRR